MKPDFPVKLLKQGGTVSRIEAIAKELAQGVRKYIDQGTITHKKSSLFPVRTVVIQECNEWNFSSPGKGKWPSVCEDLRPLVTQQLSANIDSTVDFESFSTDTGGK